MKLQSAILYIYEGRLYFLSKFEEGKVICYHLKISSLYSRLVYLFPVLLWNRNLKHIIIIAIITCWSLIMKGDPRVSYIMLLNCIRMALHVLQLYTFRAISPDHLTQLLALEPFFNLPFVHISQTSDWTVKAKCYPQC